MKSKKVKGNSTPPRSSEEEHATHRNAFTFIKNRFFSTQQQQNDQMSETRSFEENPIPEFKTTSRNTRPLSMMGMDSLSNKPEDKDALSRRNSTTDITQQQPKRSSLIVLKEGYLFKKTDFKPFHKQNKLDRGWKLYRVILRGHKLYLYKVTSESPLRSLFPSPHHHLQPPQLKQLNSNNSLSSYQSLSFSLSNSSISSAATPVTLNLTKADFDTDTQKVFFENNQSTAQGMIFTEVNPVSMQPKGQHYLISFNDRFYVCHRHDTLWTIERSIPKYELKVHWHSNGFTLFSGTYSTTNSDLGKTWISHLCDDTQIIYRDHAVQGGTIHALIHELLYNKDDRFLRVFLFTYTLFTTGSRVLTELKSIITNQLEPRLLEVFTIWCQQFSLDVMGDVATGMVEILDGIQGAQNVKELVLKTVHDNAKVNCEQKHHSMVEEEELQNIPAHMVAEGTINLSTLLITGFTPAIFLQIDPTSFAQQIYLFHFKKQKQFHNELLNPISYLPRPQISVQMLNSLLFTTVAPHFLTKIIRNQILIDSQQDTEDPLLIRSKLLEHWIQVGLALVELGDMTGWCAVVMGVCSVGVIRLRETWKAVKRDLVNHVKTDWVPILTEYGLFTQDVWADEWVDNVPTLTEFAKVLEVDHLQFSVPVVEPSTPTTPLFPPPKLIAKTESLPFFGTIRQFADRYRKHAKKHIGPDMINFDEYYCLYDKITSSLSVWNNQKQYNLDSVSIEAVGPLQLFFEHSVTEMMSLPHDYKYLQECSLACEPKIFGQTYDKQKQTTTSGDTPSMSCLVFPAILDGCSLFPSDAPKKSPQYKQNKPANEQRPAIMPVQKQDQKTVRRRTYSFPPGSSTSVSSSRLDLLESANSHTWLGSVVSGQHQRPFSSKSLVDVQKKNRDAPGGDIILSAQQDELIFKASAILFSDKPRLQKTETVRSVEILKKDQEEDALEVCIKAGNLEQLVDCLVYSVTPYQDAIKEQWQIYSLSHDFQQYQQPGRITMDQEEYTKVFFSTYRTFCSASHLLDMLRRRFMDAKKKCKKRKNSLVLLENYFTPDTDTVEDPALYDWAKLARIQLNILDLILYWIDEYSYDFMDDIEVTRYISNFLRNAKESVLSWSQPLSETDEYKEAMDTASVIKERIQKVREQFIRNSICPCYDMKAIDFDSENSRAVEDLYRQLTNGKQQYHATLQLATNKSVPLSMLSRPRDLDHKSPVDTFSPESLLEQVDQSVRQLFCAVTTQDWIQTFDVMDTQLQDIYAWLPDRKPSRTSRISSVLAPVVDGPPSYPTDYHVLPDEVVVSDIFFAIQNARRSIVAPSAFADDDLILAFPGSIQYLYCMHFIIRSWVIHEIATTEIDSKTRALRIEKFLQIVLLGKMSSEKLPDQIQKGRVPGFVECAVASALVSPEVRLFTRVWHDVAVKHGHANMDYLESLLNQIQKSPMKSSQPQYLVPSLGWLFERVVELGTQVPDVYDNKESLVHIDKRKYIYQLLQLLKKVQVDLDKRSGEMKSISMSFLISPNPHGNMTWKELREFSLKENKSAAASSSLVLRGSSSKSHRQPVFGKLVSAQLEKLKRDYKEKERIEKDWQYLQQKLQKKQVEQAKLVEKKGHSHSKSMSHQQQGYSVMPRINSFLRGLRPTSMVTLPLPHLFPYDHQQSLSIAKASTVINLIHSTTSIASTYTKRDFVFRVVTEEGAQYLFQGMSREEMQDWIKQINNAAREGAAKRQSVLVNETMDPRDLVLERKRTQPNQRLSVYGVSLDELMPHGKVPTIVEKCITEIEKRGLEEVGIYRVAGTGSTVSALKAAFNKNVDKVDLSDPDWADINVVADALKQFLRELPEPLLTYTYYDEFITASASEDHDQRIYLIKKVLKKLPQSNYTLLKRIIEHLVIVTDFEATNHMYATNLAIVFGPTLLQPAPGPTSFATTMSNLGHHQNIVKYLILNYHYLFDVESEEVEPLTKDEETK